MKPAAKFTVSLAILALVPIGASAQTPGTECNLVLNMTESLTDPGLQLKNGLGVVVKPPQPTYENEWLRKDANGNVIQTNYEFATKITTYKISNRELLEILVDEGIITEITGWSVKAVFRAFPADSSGSRPHIYIVRQVQNAPQQIIYIGNCFDFDIDASAKTHRYSTVTSYRYDAQGGLIGSTRNETGSISSKKLIDVDFESDNDNDDPELVEMDLSGIWNTTAQLRSFLGMQPAFLFVPGNGSLTGISGRLRVGNEDDSDASVVEGSWSFNGSKVLPDIGISYPEAASDDD